MARTGTKKMSISRDVVLTDQANQMEFRKANEAIGFRVVEGNLTLLIRKVFNVLMYHAQELKETGRNAPIDSPANKKYFWLPLSHLAVDAAYDSKDTEFFKQQLEKMQNIKLLQEDEREWTSERLISSVKFVNPKGLKSRSGQVWFGFAFPPEVHEKVMAPGTYTKLSILYQGMLRSGSALALYEICRRYATNPSKVTFIETYRHWYGALTGNPVMDGMELTDYKYFKRDVLKPAIAEINSLTDIEIELIEHKKGRRVEQLQFRVEKTKQPQLDFPSPPVIDVDLLEKVMKLGFGQADATDILAVHGDAKIRASLSFVHARMANKSSAPLEAPAAFFRWTLKQGAPQALALQQKQDSEAGKARNAAPDGASVMERYLAARAKDALDLFKEMDAEPRERAFARFKEQSSSAVKSKEKVMDSALLRNELSYWYAQDVWGEPTLSDITNFVDQFGIADASPRV